VSTDFRIVALASETFEAFFRMSEQELKAAGGRRVVADEKPGYSCRVSLADAEVGEAVLLVPFTHHDVASPYRASGPVYVRMGAQTASPGVGEIPEMLRGRLLSIRAYDEGAMLVGAEVLEGRDLEAIIRRLYADPTVSYLHVHNARPGCYNCRVVRA
jgi:hypothetical protein